ncbi:MAG TPA: TatD family hydrolase [Candidatus Cloacimonadota bacterium]|nr:TatD family hydrolase [Candidatus Cloacimonadota bacterium]
MLIDAHCHLANLNDLMPLRPLLEEAARNRITSFLSSALRKQEVAFYKELSDPRVRFSAGIHPNFDECDLELSDIIELCDHKDIWAVGEIGLDRNGPDLEFQKDMFQAQLELSAQYQLPVVLHIVGHQQEAWELLKQYPLRYLVHGYAGSVEGYRLLASEDSRFTISARILRPDKLELLNAVLADGRYLFETDITQYYVHEGEANPLLRLLEVLEQTAAISEVAKEVLIQTQEFNYQYLIEGRHV